MLENDCNQQVTKCMSSLRLNLVGTSETTREALKTLYNKLIKFNQWLAGLIDGSGSFYINKKTYLSCEIILNTLDLKTLKQIQNKFGGSIKFRSGNNSVRWRLLNKTQMFKLINSVNGNIRNNKRLIQFHQVADLLNIKVKSTLILNLNNAWFMGFFDSSGSISYLIVNNKPQLFISVSNQYSNNILDFKLFGGNILFDKSGNGKFLWLIKYKSDIFNFLDYNKSNPSKTIKFNKLLLINEYYKLKDIKAYNIDSDFFKSWLSFINKWNLKLFS